ncbi:MAG: PadR family transcriptional regulator [Candidatus Hydrogenedentes bacterium]|nr:PadR family transcriptional regulator [Candidatus Hydrogenedentota bacterium]
MSEPQSEFNLSNWVTQARKGLLELCILSLLSKGDIHAYELVKRLAGMRALVVTEGTVYPLLSRLRAAGLLESRLEESSSGPARRYYGLTDKGRQSIHMMQTHWKELVKEVEILMESGQDHD